MDREWITRVLIGSFVGIVLTLLAPVAQAGPTLVCWPFDIGGARSLPWGGSGWRDAQSGYDLNRLPADTLALLIPDAPVLVRMETLRRAAIYAQKDPLVAKELFSRLEDRAGAAKSSDKSDPLALFDWGYFTEAYRQAAMMGHSTMELGKKVNGNELVQRALALRGPDAQMEFAAALVASVAGQRDAANQHLAKAAAAAADGSLLAKNLVTHCHLFQMHAETLAGLRAQLVAAKK